MTPTARDPLWKLGAYLHQDWEDYYPDFHTAIRTLMENEPHDVTASMLKYVRELLKSDATDKEIGSILKRRIDYAFEMDGMNARQFLQEILRIGEESSR